MARGYSRDLRERLRQAVASGLSVIEVAQRTGVSPSSLRRWKAKQAAGQSLTPGTSPGGPRKIGEADEPGLRAQVAAAPDATLAEHVVHWAADRHVVVSVATMSRALAGLDLPLKKDADRHRTRRAGACPVAHGGSRDCCGNHGLSR